jgi:hypothetical protein
MQGFSTRLYTNLLLTNLIKDILHYINIVLPLTTYSSARSTFIKILVSFGFTTRIFFRKHGSIPNYRKAKLENRVERYMELTILVLSRANAPHHTSSFYIVHSSNHRPSKTNWPGEHQDHVSFKTPYKLFLPFFIGFILLFTLLMATSMVS